MKRKSGMKANIGMAALSMILAASLGLATIPTGAVQANIQVTDDETLPMIDREGGGAGVLEKVLRREMKINNSLYTLLRKADKTVIQLEEAIAKGQANDWAVSDLENELEKLTRQLVKARASHARAAKLLADPAGFDGHGQVINREIAFQSVKQTHQIQQEVRHLLGSSLRDARQAIRDYRQDNSIGR
jgi:hypothetical protein